MHKLGVAHRQVFPTNSIQKRLTTISRDCSDNNIMFDGARMYKKGFHAIYWNLDPNGNPTFPRRRSDVPKVKYYFTDFGMSSRFLEGDLRLVLGVSGLDEDLPDLSGFKPYDPFQADIFILGNVFKRNFTSVGLNRFSCPR